MLKLLYSSWIHTDKKTNKKNQNTFSKYITATELYDLNLVYMVPDEFVYNYTEGELINVS